MTNEELKTEPTMDETKTFARKCFGGYKPSEYEFKRHTENLKVFVAEQHNIEPSEAEGFLEKQGQARYMQKKFGKIGRNQPCPCGSGIKFKKCHGKFVR